MRSSILLGALLAMAWASSAQVTTNHPPYVAIVSPTNGSVFTAPTNIFLLAQVNDRDGDVVEVSFFANQRYIGGVTNPPPMLTPGIISPLPPWRISWQNVAAGLYSLQARARDASGTIAWSAPIRIEVRGSNQERTFVTIEAVDPVAGEQDPRLDALTDDALLVVRRHGPTNITLHVQYRVGGTASNGVDYHALSGEVTIPAGALSADIVVSALDDQDFEDTESVIVHLVPPICITIYPPPPECYEVGQPGGATAYIRDNDQPPPPNAPPHVRITAPTNGANFSAGSDITIEAVTVDEDGYAPYVEFFANDRKIGEQLITFVQAPPDGTPIHFEFAWQDVAAGAYRLTARATDDMGATRWSDSVQILVGTNRPPPPPTIVTIETVDPIASEPSPVADMVMPDNAVLRVRRHGETTDDLTVYYRLGGTASNSVDYFSLPGEVVIPAGSVTADIVIQAFDDRLVEGTESVIVAVETPICASIFPPPPGCYVVGTPARATAYIRDNDFAPSNHPPVVQITLPKDGATFPPGADIRIEATTTDQDGYAPMIEFFANGRKIGEEVIQFIQPPPDGTPIHFSFLWSNVVAGAYTLTALGTDDDGARAFSAPVFIRVETNRPPPPPPTNVVVSIIATDCYASEGPWWNSTSVRGTNTAAFVIRRAGPTNNPVTVRYHVGGTAANGTDYVRLPGEATVPAGARSARIVVVPLEDAQIEGLETVVLELAAAGEPAAYLLGQPRRAAAIIADNDQRPHCVRLPGGLFHLCRPGTNGHGFRIDASSDLVNWNPVCNGVVTDGAIHFVDPDADALPRRFYRVVPEINVLQE